MRPTTPGSISATTTRRVDTVRFTLTCSPTPAGGTDAWLTSEQAAGAPVGLVFSHVRYPFIKSGEVFDTGEFIIRVHRGDWHQGSLFYRKWFLEHFPFDKSGSWLRRQSSWFSSIIYQPEDRIVADYKTYDRWAKDAEEFGIRCHELIGWNKGGLERDYPEYYPEPKLGGWEGYRALLRSIKSRGSRCLTFVNYNILDSAGEEYKRALKPYTRQDQFGSTPNWMAWGESTLIARKGLSVRRHLLASVVPPLQDLLEKRFLQLVEAGADGFQIDKTCCRLPPGLESTQHAKAGRSSCVRDWSRRSRACSRSVER